MVDLEKIFLVFNLKVHFLFIIFFFFFLLNHLISIAIMIPTNSDSAWVAPVESDSYLTLENDAHNKC